MQSRRTFLAAASTAAAVPILIQGCGPTVGAEGVTHLSDADDFADVVGTVATNHGHAAVVPQAAIAAGAGVEIDIQGTSTHPHALVLTAADIAKLRAGETITVTSSVVAGHSHAVTLAPAFGVDGEVGTNHGHRAFLSPAAFQVQVSIKGSSGHDHVITLGVDELVAIRNGEPVTLTSSKVAGHAHTVVFNPPA